MLTITQAMRPVLVHFGESINLFYSSLTRGMYFYESLPLTLLVTIVLVFLTTLLFLLMFGYEFSFLFNMFKLSKHPENYDNLKQQDQQDEIDQMRHSNSIRSSQDFSQDSKYTDNSYKLSSSQSSGTIS